MTGTLMVSTEAVHTYQRRFSTSTLALAVGAANLYIVTRRPRTRIVDYSNKVATFSIGNDDSTMVDARLPSEIYKFSADPSGQYFKFHIESKFAHGESWALATLLSNAHPIFSRHEVLYIGKAEDVGARLKRHSTLQQIYEDHATTEWDIFVTPLIISATEFVNADHIENPSVANPQHGFLEEFFEWFGKRNGGRATNGTINLAEHAMISYFRPKYNNLLKVWSGQRKSPEMEFLWRVGFRLATFRVQGAFELARFETTSTRALRSHSIACEIPDNPRESGFGAMHIEEIPHSGDDYFYQVMANMAQGVDDFNEQSSPSLTVFGDPPALATPPDIIPWLNEE
ncbi:hypothetical protein [Promicromonospora sukumoe]|uniref:hypothetical protein n=1 Tax=Promicromonospora sukumoe TaxID=88382 RepID=UPI0012F8083B|nr:hypothetical protein [Promicromonospora sukumoe]